MKYMDKHLNYFIVGVPNCIKSYSNQKVFVREKGGFNNGKKNGIKMSALRSDADACKEL